MYLESLDTREDLLLDPTHSNVTVCIEGAGTNVTKATDIRQITYSNNGKTLGTTLWLPNNFSVSPMEYIPTYGFVLDVNPEIGDGADYNIQIKWANVTKKWFKSYLEEKVELDLGSSELSRNFMPETNMMGFYQDGKNYVDLDLIILPGQYEITTYASTDSIVGTSLCRFRDISLPVYVPAQKFPLTLLLNSVALKPGESEDILISIKSNVDREVNITPLRPNLTGLAYQFVPKMYQISPLGTPIFVCIS